jgi:hypothetical protein
LDPDLYQLLSSVNVLLGHQCQMMQFQHISGVLWAWSQVRRQHTHTQKGGGSLHVSCHDIC